MFKSIKKFLKEVVGIPRCILVVCLIVCYILIMLWVLVGQEESYNTIISQVKFVRSAVDMVCCDIKQQDVEVGIDEPFRVETRYYLRAKDKTTSYDCYVTEPLALNDTITQYTIKAVLPKDYSVDFAQQPYTVQYYDVSDEDSQRADLTATVVAAVQQAIRHTTIVFVFMFSIVFVVTLSAVLLFFGRMPSAE